MLTLFDPQIYLGAYLCFTLVFILLALSPNITGILIGRALSGLFGCVGTILVGGTLADICPSPVARWGDSSLCQ